MQQYEAQSSETLQDTIKAAILAHNHKIQNGGGDVGLNADEAAGV